MAKLTKAESRLLGTASDIVARENNALSIDGRAICGAKVSSGECQLGAGWGTSHPGSGRCSKHEAVKTRPDRSLVSKDSLSDSYSVIVKHRRLKEFLAEESDDLLDNEIRLARAMIKVIAEEFGMTVDPESQQVTEVRGFEGLSAHAKTIAALQDSLSNLIKRKYELLAIASNTIPRERVLAYINQVQLVLDKLLRNTCDNCGYVHKTRDTVIKALSRLEDV